MTIRPIATAGGCAFTEAAERLVEDIDSETRRAGNNTDTLTEIARSATVAVDLIAAARRRAEDAWFNARETNR